MSHLIRETVESSVAIAGVWIALSVPVALMVGRVLKTRNARETELR